MSEPREIWADLQFQEFDLEEVGDGLTRTRYVRGDIADAMLAALESLMQDPNDPTKWDDGYEAIEKAKGEDG